MKSVKNLEKLLNERGFELRYEKMGYYDNVPLAVKQIDDEEIKIFLVYEIINYDTRSSTIDFILKYDITKAEIINVIERYLDLLIESPYGQYFENSVVFGRIEVLNGKIKRTNYIDEI